LPLADAGKADVVERLALKLDAAAAANRKRQSTGNEGREALAK
jgi:hypothetical protein